MRWVARALDRDIRKRLPVVRVGVAVLGLFASAAAFAADDAQQLQRLRERIEALQRDLNDTRDRRDAVREELQQHERRIDVLMRSVSNVTARLAAGADQLEELKHDAAAERRRRARHVHALEAQLRAAYLAGPQEPLKLLLNQEQPAQVARVMTYYRYVNAARIAHIADIQRSLARAAALEAEIRVQTQALAATRADQEREQTALREARDRRAALLARLERDVTHRSQELARLRADERRLERLVEEIRRALPPAPGRRGRFAAARGRLPLPFPGHVTARFGQPKQGDLGWRGIFLTGSEGQNVQAVFRGRVAYADWLRGFGLLLILDHGDGYMTLYGHNQALYRQVGDWVEAGQAIAAVGNTGDAPATGVYFEIRHNGKPYDPLQWCTATRARGRP